MYQSTLIGMSAKISPLPNDCQLRCQLSVDRVSIEVLIESWLRYWLRVDWGYQLTLDCRFLQYTWSKKTDRFRKMLSWRLLLRTLSRHYPPFIQPHLFCTEVVSLTSKVHIKIYFTDIYLLLKTNFIHQELLSFNKVNDITCILI